MQFQIGCTFCLCFVCSVILVFNRCVRSWLWGSYTVFTHMVFAQVNPLLVEREGERGGNPQEALGIPFFFFLFKIMDSWPFRFKRGVFSFSSIWNVCVCVCVCKRLCVWESDLGGGGIIFVFVCYAKWTLEMFPWNVWGRLYVLWTWLLTRQNPNLFTFAVVVF